MYFLGLPVNAQIGVCGPIYIYYCKSGNIPGTLKPLFNIVVDRFKKF